MTLKADRELATSPVVANCRMTRQRGATGVNSYARELGLDPIVFLRERALSRGRASWTDLCCGEGRALTQAHEALAAIDVRLTGIDLLPPASHDPQLIMAAASVVEAPIAPAQDLVTCVHGLHYVGDKLAVIARACGAIAPGGLFLAHLDPENLRFPGGSAGRSVIGELRRQGLRWDSRRRLLRCEGPRDLALPFTFLGADDAAGPNATGQPAVTSVYAPSAHRTMPCLPS